MNLIDTLLSVPYFHKLALIHPEDYSLHPRKMSDREAFAPLHAYNDSHSIIVPAWYTKCHNSERGTDSLDNSQDCPDHPQELLPAPKDGPLRKDRCGVRKDRSLLDSTRRRKDRTRKDRADPEYFITKTGLDQSCHVKGSSSSTNILAPAVRA